MYKVYYLPKCNYCGYTSRDIKKRLWEHENLYNRDISNCEILSEFETKREALDFERRFQEEQNAEGFIYNDKWRKFQSKRMKDNPIHIKRQRRIICLDTGKVFKSLRNCAREYNSSHANLSRHLKKHPKHQTFCELKFEYYEE